MVSEMVTPAAVALLALSLAMLFFLQPADDSVAAEVLLGDWREDEGSLPPIFVNFNGASEPQLDTLVLEDVVLEVKRMRGHGIVLYLNMSGTSGKVRLPNAVLPWAEELYQILHHGVRLVLRVEEYNIHAAKLLASVFRRWPDMTRRALVVSSSPSFLFTLGGNNKAIVKALAWRPCSVAYEDAKCTRPRNEKLVWHLVALAGDWLYQWYFEWGLLTRVSMASAVVVDARMVSSRFVRFWSERGVRVLALASDEPAEQEYLRVHRVPIVARYISLPGCQWC